MDRRPTRFKYELVILAGTFLAAGLFWLVMKVEKPFSASSINPSFRQSIPPPDVLELPPSAPLPSGPHPYFSKITPEASPSPTPDKPAGGHPAKKPRKPKPKIPSRWEILKAYQQVIELDMKYIRIAVTSDRYGYRNQAMMYYRKYLSIDPTGPYANQVRQRLSQLENSP